jgi:hypothetical protein
MHRVVTSSHPVSPYVNTPLVTRAILQRWRHAYTGGTFEELNDAESPP